ncbi:MAG: sulfite exporter TauE/SafE family protein [Chloroflexi bacterium]|nr:sulfite exporter TauE/SafE family protein [Chloroflexota bacterium]
MLTATFAVTITVGLAAGLLAGLLGVGGGIIMIPAMVLLLGIKQHMAQGNSLAVMAALAFVGSAVHYRHGNVDLRAVLWMAPAAITFGFLGSWLAGMIDATWLRRGFGILLLFVGLRMVLSRQREGRQA